MTLTLPTPDAGDTARQRFALELLLQQPVPGPEQLLASRILLSEGKTAQLYSQIQTGGEQGMQTLEKALANLVLNGDVSRAEAMGKASKPGELQRLIGEI